MGGPAVGHWLSPSPELYKTPFRDDKIGVEDIFIKLDGETKKVGGVQPADVRALLARLSLSEQEALVRVDGRIRPESFPVNKKNKIEVIRVVFGG